METATKPLEYRESLVLGATDVYRDGKPVGMISALCDPETGTAFYLWDKARTVAINRQPLATLNQAKALAEYHFTQQTEREYQNQPQH